MKMTLKNSLFVCMVCLIGTFPAMHVRAETPEAKVSDSDTDEKSAQEIEQQKPSLFFTADELEKLYAARKEGLEAGDKPKDSNQVQQTHNDDVAPAIDPGPRVLKLSGIIYHGDDDWVIWFNNMRITPKNKPEHMLGILVRQDRIALKWMDVGTNRIINLVLHPHQEYHIDTDTITIGTY